MPDRLIFDLPSPVQIAAPFLSALPPQFDESLFLSASARWRESSDGLHGLMGACPGIRETLEQLLKQELNLDGQQAGLLFTRTAEHPERFVSLTAACAYVMQHPTLETTLDQQCRVTGLNHAHALSQLTPLQWLERLKELDPERSHGERWRTFWEARAPGTPVSRQTYVIQQYRSHFEAAAQIAFAQRTLTAEQLKRLQLIIDAPSGGLAASDERIHTEQLTLVLSNKSRIKPTGAWVITTAGLSSDGHLLYLPSRSVAIQRFDQRSDMQAWLSRQALVPSGLPDSPLQFEYTARTDPLTVGASDLFAAYQQAQITALRHGSHGKAGMANHGAHSLAQADQVDLQLRKATVIASPPRLQAAHEESLPDEPSLFGSLYADIPWDLRQAALKKQRDALQALIEEVGSGDGLQPFKDSLKTLGTAEDNADNAASALLNRSRTLDVVTFQREFAHLHSAHKSALLAEAQLQLRLKQLSVDEHKLITTLLDTSDESKPDAVAASLTLSMSEQNGDKTTVHAQEIKGAFVVTQAHVLTDADSPHSVILYWPGSGGGLQRFSNRRELERQVFKVDGQENGAALALKKISGDALQYSLNGLNTDFEEQAGSFRQRHADAAEAGQLAEQLEMLRQKARSAFQVPVHAARTLSFAHVLEQNDSGVLSANLAGWLTRLTEVERIGLKNLIEAYILAMRKSHALMTIALEPRDDFTRKHLHARLTKDFSIEGHFAVQVELPDSTTTQTVPQSGPGGIRKTTVIVPGNRRSKMSLEDLAQLNVDNVHSVLEDAVSKRLIFMRLEVTAARQQDRFRLLNGINLPYLRKVLPELDLPKAYEQKILDTFLGGADEPVFVRQHRRESLVEPWRLMLKIQGECARLQHHINSDELQVLNIAIDANTPQAWLAKGKRVVLLPVSLGVGGKDTRDEGPVTLSGVNFIEEQLSAITLLYLPDSPDGQFLRRYDNLEAARKGLYTLCGDDKWVSYLAGKTLHGNVRAHVNRINQAVDKHFDAVIAVGVRWPQTTSLAAHLLDAHMGRLIEAHRGSSRSNDDLFLERYALTGPRAFNYMKMAMGMVPFVGSALALYDAWTAANQAVAAFLRGEVGDGVAQIESMLLSLIDAFMDLLPGEALTAAASRTARSLTQSRQLHRLARNVAAVHGASRRQARHVAKRFNGYDYEQPISLADLQPGKHGLYRGIYRHADGNFIERQGRLFQVELDRDSQSWRLLGNSQKTYKQPIAMNEAGDWDTWYGVYGSTQKGGGLGGGQALGHLADAIDPLWPLAIRHRLPRWWADRTFRRHHQLTETIDDLAPQLNTRVKKTSETLNRYHDATPENRPALMPAADAECVGDIEFATRQYNMLAELKPLTSGRKQRSVIEMQSSAAWLLTDRYRQRAIFLSQSSRPLTDQILKMSRDLDNLPANALSARLILLEDIRKLRVEFVNKLDELETLKGDVNRWFDRIGLKKDKDQIKHQVDALNTTLSDANLTYLRAAHRLEIVKHYGTVDEVSWLYLQGQAQKLRARVDRALYMQDSLPEVSVTREQRNQILQNCITLYTQFRREMKVWTTSYPQHFHMDAVEPLLNGIDKMSERARKAIDHPALSAPAGEIRKKVFSSEDGEWLIGVEKWDPKKKTRHYQINDGEVWAQTSDGKFRLQAPSTVAPAPAPAQTITALVEEAGKRLDFQPTYLAKVKTYADQDMLPVDLEHMMVSEAAELTRRADRIQKLDAQNPLIQKLRDEAGALKITGREMRTRQALTTKKPTGGMLADLLEQDAVEIRKTSPLKNLGKRKEGRIDYLQEYEIWDKTLTPSELLWYAHFHYASAKPVMRQFEKAHLKLPEHRFLTHADDANLPYADIGKRSTVVDHFERF
ncbi:dermonecrotic toxin domain-containing protein [Pseudomonas sp. PB3P13]